MILRTALQRQAQRALRQSRQHASRGYAATSDAALQYQTGDAQGIKYASRDNSGAVSSIALVSKAGTRYETAPGLAEALNRYAFRSTERRSTLRIQRESELLGSDLIRHHTRENHVVGAKFLRGDLPYFLELIAEVATQTKYQQHVVNEEIIPLMELNAKNLLGNTLAMANESVHALAFHRGLGAPVHATSSIPFKKYVTADSIAEYAQSAFAKPNFALVANGVENSELTKWIGEFFEDVSSTPAVELKSEQSKYYGGEERIAHASGNSLVLGFAGSSSPVGNFYKPEIAVLAALLGGESSIKWSRGFSLLSKVAEGASPNTTITTKSHIYTDAGLFAISIDGPASDIRTIAPKVVETLQSVSQNLGEEDFNKAKALAKFKELEFASGTQAGMEYTGAGLVRTGKPYQINEVAQAYDSVTLDQVKQIAKEALENKASVSAVGDLYVLPYASEIGLKV